MTLHEVPVYNPPLRKAYSKEQMIKEAKAYMIKTFGPCKEAESREKWYQRLGMLVDFIGELFPESEGGKKCGP